jgi:hypothetical protein
MKLIKSSTCKLSLTLNVALKILPHGQLHCKPILKLHSLHIDDADKHGQKNNAFTIKPNISPKLRLAIIPATAIRKVNPVANSSSGELGDVGDISDVSKYSMSTQSDARHVSLQLGGYDSK